MKKLLFVAMAVIAMLVSCKPDTKVPTISNVSQNPEIVVADQEVTVTATVAGAEEFTIKLYFTVNADSYEADMIPANELNTYKGVIPGQADGAKVSYYIQVVAGEVVVKTDSYDYLVGIAPAPVGANIMLNELSGVNKFIEIYNPTDAEYVLENVYIEKDAKDAPIWVGDGTITVPARGYVVLWSEDKVADHPELEGTNYIFGSGLSSKKTVRIALFKGEFPNGEQLDLFTRGNAELDPEGWGLTITNVDKAFARTPDGGEWKLADETPGEANPATGDDIPQE
jgi:hypothetical protein